MEKRMTGKPASIAVFWFGRGKGVSAAQTVIGRGKGGSSAETLELLRNTSHACPAAMRPPVAWQMTFLIIYDHLL